MTESSLKRGITALQAFSPVLRDQVARDQLVAECIVVNISPDEQIAQKIRVQTLVLEHSRKVIEEAPALGLAPIAPNLHLSKLLTVIEQLLRQGYTPTESRILCSEASA